MCSCVDLCHVQQICATLNSCVQERDFYFSKLREIELLCQQDGIKEAWDVMQHVENVLYAATEEEGTQARLSALDALNVATAVDGAA